MLAEDSSSYEEEDEVNKSTELQAPPIHKIVIHRVDTTVHESSYPEMKLYQIKELFDA